MAVLERLSKSLEDREDIHEFGRRVLIRGGLAVLLFGGALKGGVFGAIADHMPDIDGPKADEPTDREIKFDAEGYKIAGGVVVGQGETKPVPFSKELASSGVLWVGGGMPKVGSWGTVRHPEDRALLVGAGLRQVVVGGDYSYASAINGRRIQRVQILGPFPPGAVIRPWAETASERIDAQTEMTDITVTFQPGTEEIIVEQPDKNDDNTLSRVVLLLEMATTSTSSSTSLHS